MPETKTVCVHYGSCDICKKRNIQILHFNYDVQPDRDFRLCGPCTRKYIHSIIEFAIIDVEDKK